MTKKTLIASLFAGAAMVVLTAAPVQAGSYTVAPGATIQVDVAERGGYTTITVVNSGDAAGSLQLPAGGSTIAVPGNGRVELYDRYSSGPTGNSFVAVTNTGSVPLRVTSRYVVRLPLP